MSGLSEAKLKTLMFLPCATAPLSFLGSVLVMICIFRHKKSARFKSVYHRLMFGLSTLDIFFSVGYALGPLPIPAEYQNNLANLRWAKGTIPTCSAQGFFVQFGYLSYGYSMCLTVYYVVTIRFNLQERYVATYIEPWMHVSVLGFGLITAVLNVALKYSNPGLPTCWVSANPPFCGRTDDYPCIRGKGFETFGRWVIVYPNFVFSGVIAICLATVMWTVCRQRQLARRFVFGVFNHGNNTNNTGSSANSSGNNPNNSAVSTVRRRASFLRTSTSDGATDTSSKFDAVVTQCLLYGSNFFMCNFWFTFQGMLVVTDNPNIFSTYFPVLVLANFFFPLQGFFNFLIFVRPRYQQWRRREPLATKWWAMKNALWNPTMKYGSANNRPSNNMVGAGGGNSAENGNIPSSSRKTGSNSPDGSSIIIFGGGDVGTSVTNGNGNPMHDTTNEKEGEEEEEKLAVVDEIEPGNEQGTLETEV